MYRYIKRTRSTLGRIFGGLKTCLKSTHDSESTAPDSGETDNFGNCCLHLGVAKRLPLVIGKQHGRLCTWHMPRPSNVKVLRSVTWTPTNINQTLPNEHSSQADRQSPWVSCLWKTFWVVKDKNIFSGSIINAECDEEGHAGCITDFTFTNYWATRQDLNDYCKWANTVTRFFLFTWHCILLYLIYFIHAHQNYPPVYFQLYTFVFSRWGFLYDSGRKCIY